MGNWAQGVEAAAAGIEALKQGALNPIAAREYLAL